MHPRIGIAAAPALVGPFPVYAVNRVYVTAVRGAGGLPVVVPILDPSDAVAMVSELDGLVLSGGGDLDPGTYGGATVPELVGVDAARDSWDLALVAAAEELGVPVLGICRGLQALNVSAGGTLVPHLPHRTDQPHWVTARESETVHTVAVVEGSLLHGLTGLACGVNSLHHQAVDRVGHGLRVVAVAPDGITEAVEDTRWGRTLGVQWHPELLPSRPEQRAVLSWLVDAAGAWRSQRHGATRSSVPGDTANLHIVTVESPAAADSGMVA